MGEVLIAGTASLLICIFLSPKFIAYLRRREFGQQIREEGPQEHHAKAGTPTMGGIIIFTAVTVPFVLLTDWDWRAVGVFGTALACALLGFADDYVKLARRRSLGLRGRTKLIVTILIAVGLWLIATEWAGLPDTVNLRIIDAAARRIGLPMERVAVNIDEYGNTSSASIPLALEEAVRKGRVKSGDHVLLAGFGSGLTWGATLLKWA